jgi:hypothetical protein
MTTEQKEEEIGNKIAKQLGLRLAKDDLGKPFNPVRYKLGHDHGTKTAVGLCRTIQLFGENAKAELAEHERNGKLTYLPNYIKDPS